MLNKLLCFSILPILFSILSETEAGTLTPYGDNNIYSSIANRGQKADYTFSFVPDTTIPALGIVRVFFPTQYVSDLGITDASCSVACTVSGYQVDFTLTSEVTAGTSTNVTIYQVTNPNIKGGTGNFKIQTLWGVNVLDENLIFDVLGIADAVGTLTSTIISVSSTGLSNAGETTRYTFQFKVSQLIPSGSYMKFTLADANFGLTNFPACNAYAINGKTIEGKFFCETSGRNILVYGLEADIPASQDVGISVAMINPKFSGVTDSFTIAVLRGGTNVIYDVKTGIAGVTISAGLITNIALEQVDTQAIQSRKKLMDYTLSFQLTNGLTRTSVIVLEFPPSFVIDLTAARVTYIEYGLEDIAEDNTVGLSVDSNNVMRLTNFMEFDEPHLISVYLRLMNPDNVGETTPINIRTYKDVLQTILVDQNTASAYTVIQDITSPSSHTITSNTVYGNELQASIEFSLSPSVSIPQAGAINIRVPDAFSLGTISAANCLIRNQGGTSTTAASCTNIGNTITLKFPTSMSFPLGRTSYFQLNNIITTPYTNGTYLFDITSYLSDGTTVIESWTDYMIVQPVLFTSASIVSLEATRNYKTVLTATFTTPVAIPAGITQHKATDAKGFIEFQFSLTSNDLGFGITTATSIPCNVNSGLVPISDRVVCTLIPGTIPLLRVDGFQDVSEQTVISLSIPGILNPTANFQVNMKTIKLENRIRTQYNNLPFTIATYAALFGAVATGTGNYILSSLDVSTATSITFSPTFAAGVTGPGNLIIQLPKYDIGWITSTTSVTCKIGSQVYSCTGFYGADWITIPLSTAADSLGTTGTVTIENLRVPRYSDVNVGGINARFSNSANRATECSALNALPTATVPQFDQATIIADKKNKGAANVQYTLIFMAKNDIPEGATITISFPTDYNLLSSTPAVSFSTSDLLPISGLDKVSFSASIESLTISGFQTQPAYSVFSIVVSGVKNPTTLTYSQPWRAQVFLNSNLMFSHLNFDQFAFTPAPTVGTITYNSIQSIPLNAGEDSKYILNIVPTNQIPAGGSIKITFPAGNYDSLPSPPSCRLSGGVTTFTSCALSGTAYTITLDSKYTSGGIIVQIDDVRNPDRGETDPFSIQTYYDGVLLDDTDTTTTTGRTVTIVDEATTILVNSISFDPKNEGEPANYTFSFVPTNTIESTMEIIVTFPSVYDKTLGSTIFCTAPSGLLGDISCSVSDRQVTISGFETYLPDTTAPVIISIFGVTNPNQDQVTGQFKIGTRIVGAQAFVDYNSAVGTFTISTAPGWAVLYNIVPDNLKTRLTSSYFFNFTAFASVPKTSSQGAIKVDFPTEFEIPDGDANCDTTTDDFSPVVTCSFLKNKLSISGQTQDYSGNVGFIVRNLMNPIEKGTAKNILLKTYDGLNSLILERSYKNLDPFVFTYQYPGPLIYINSDETITAIRGTQTADLYVTLDFPCALNLTLKSSTPGFSVIPFAIKLSLGQTKAKFRVSVPESFATGTYEIEWETQGDIIPPYYTPIKNTPVIVVEQTRMTIQAPTINAVPFGGNSLPCSFTIDNGPDIEIQISVNFLVTYPGISLSTNLVNFTAGTTSAGFIIYSDSEESTRVQKGTLVLSLTGINQNIYSLSATTLQFQVTNPDLSLPYITDFTIANITQNSVIITIGTSELCMVYYMLALDGTVAPELDEVIFQGPAPYTTTESQYGVVQVLEGETEIVIVKDNLVAETPYIVYAYLVDGGNNTNTLEFKTFRTLNRDNGVTFNMKFNVFDLNQAETEQIVNSISFILSLWPNKLQEFKYATGLNSLETDRLLQEEDDSWQPKFTFRSLPAYEPTAIEKLFESKRKSRVLQDKLFVLLNLQLAATPESSVYPSPKTLALSLNDKDDLIKARLSDADVSFRIEAFEFTRYQPAFPSAPFLDDVSLYWASFAVKLSNYGFVFVTCVPEAENFGKPTPYQVLRGYDNRNIARSSANVEISEPYDTYKINVTGLTALTNYTAYIIGGSAHPGYPDPMNGKDIVAIKFMTKPAKEIARLNIKGQPLLKVAYGGLLALVSLWFII